MAGKYMGEKTCNDIMSEGLEQRGGGKETRGEGKRSFRRMLGSEGTNKALS